MIVERPSSLLSRASNSSSLYSSLWMSRLCSKSLYSQLDNVTFLRLINRLRQYLSKLVGFCCPVGTSSRWVKLHWLYPLYTKNPSEIRPIMPRLSARYAEIVLQDLSNLVVNIDLLSLTQMSRRSTSLLSLITLWYYSSLQREQLASLVFGKKNRASSVTTLSFWKQIYTFWIQSIISGRPSRMRILRIFCPTIGFFSLGLATLFTNTNCASRDTSQPKRLSLQSNFFLTTNPTSWQGQSMITSLRPFSLILQPSGKQRYSVKLYLL